MSIYFVCQWYFGFFMRAITAWLSEYIDVGSSCSVLRDFNRLHNQVVSLIDSISAISSAIVIVRHH